MKKKILACILLAGLITAMIGGCQTTTRSLGGSMTIKLEPNTKLELVTWKDDSLWYLTRPMTENDVAETHTYQQSSEFGIFEGTVTIVETKK